MRNWQCRLNFHCNHTMDKDTVWRTTHHGRDREAVVIFQVECCRCDRVDFGEFEHYGPIWENARQEREDR